MPRRIREEELQAIEVAVGQRPKGLTTQQIHDALPVPPPRRTLQYRVKFLVDHGRLHREGSGRWARYLPPRRKPLALTSQSISQRNEVRRTGCPPQTGTAARIQQYVVRALGERAAAEFHPAFLEAYRPNETFFLGGEQLARLGATGRMRDEVAGSGAYASKTLRRFLIDLSFNSSRLEGNGYSRLETELLVQHGEAARGRTLRETQMVLNHKAAIGLLTSAAEGIGINRHTLLNLHSLLAENLLSNSQAAGRLRRAPARISGSTYQPPADPGEIEAQFDRLLATASAISDPFEQSFFLLTQLPYLQAFDDINKRVARLAANIPLIKAYLAPLAFEGVPRDVYDQAVLGVNELRRRQLLREVFVFAYQHSASQFGNVRHVLGEPDPLRLKYRGVMREVIGEIVRYGMNKARAAARIRSWSQQRIDPGERIRLRDIAERELLNLHPGNCARYRIDSSEFEAWQQHWEKHAPDAPISGGRT